VTAISRKRQDHEPRVDSPLLYLSFLHLIGAIITRHNQPFVFDVEKHDPLPTSGRPIPPDERATDLLREMTLLTRSAEAASDELQRFHSPSVLPGPVILNDEGLGFQEGFLVHDPDGML
jgi:hypothetical protein